MSGNLLGIGKATNNMNKRDLGFRVFINEGELNQIHSWVLLHPNIETGGDLFGLWIDEHTAVVQFVLGPGKKCRRDLTSFYQDVNYLKIAGSYLTKAHGLCNIGQWHSHHTIKLSKPSAGDDSTVWNNMPSLGLDKYIVFIANITSSDKVTVNCFLYQIKNGRKRPVEKGEFQYLDANSPLRLNENLLQHIFVEAETFNAITLFGKEKHKITDYNAKGNPNILVQNESGSLSYTRNSVQNTLGVSGGQQDTVNSCMPKRIADETRKLENNKKESRNTATVYHIPETERQANAKRSVDYRGWSTMQANPRDTQRNTQSQTMNETRVETSEQATNTPSYRGTHNSSTVDRTRKQNNTRTASTTKDQDPKMNNVSAISKETQKSGHSVKTPMTNTQSTQRVETTSQNLLKLHAQKRTIAPIKNNQDPQHVDTSLPDTRNQQGHNESTTTTGQRLKNSASRSTAKEWQNKATTSTQADTKVTSSHELFQNNSGTILVDVEKQKENEEKLDIKHNIISSTNSQQRQDTIVKCNSSKGVPVIVKQPERCNRKRESVYDNVESDNEPERKKGRSISETNENQPTVDERPSTPSGTISAEYHHKSKQTGNNCDVVQSTCGWEYFRSVCCITRKMSKLNIHERKTETVELTGYRDKKMDGDSKTKDNREKTYV